MTDQEFRTEVRKAALTCPLSDPVERFVWTTEWVRSHPPPETLLMAEALREVVKSELIQNHLEYQIEIAIGKHNEKVRCATV